MLKAIDFESRLEFDYVAAALYRFSVSNLIPGDSVRSGSRSSTVPNLIPFALNRRMWEIED
jgi:hypothetical protein